MKKRPTISDVMTLEPVTVHRSQPLSEVYDLFESTSFNHVPVVDGDKPVGVISSTDILKLVYDVEGLDDRMLRTMLDHQFKIDDAMTSDVVTVVKSANLREVVDTMSSGAIHSALIVDDEGDLTGIVTTTDLIRALGALL